MRTIILSAVAMALAVAGAVFAGPYSVDTSHATVGFTVKHLGLSKVPGEFGKYEASIDYDGSSIESLRVGLTIDAASINTRHAKRDAHLLGTEGKYEGHFFAVNEHPEITFVTHGVTSTGEGTGKLAGELTMRGVSKNVELDLQLNGPIDSPWQPGVKLIGVNLTGEVNRQDFGVSMPGLSDKGIGDTVKINVSLEASGGGE